MALSNDIIMQLVKSNKETKQPSETTVLGTVVVDGRTYVRLDGSDLLTPVNTTSAVKNDDRVNVLIKNHTATITGNMSDPSASGAVVEAQGQQITEFEEIVANKITVDQLEAVYAHIKTLEADFAKIGKLEAVEAEIEKLKAGIIEADRITAEDIEAINATIQNLTATYGEFESLYAEELKAIKGDIQELDVGKLSADVATITYATIEDLNATNANITNLNADVGKIDTLIFGAASGDTIQSEFANAVVSQISQAQIKDAMIDSVSAGKIMAGDIYTNNVRVMSEDGQLLIADETIQISDDNRVRVQIGKDASNDYSINIWDAEGNLMFSEGGITENAVKNAIIRDDMVSDDANIKAGKLDISSLFSEINGSTETIKSNKIFLDSENQTLEIAFTQMSSDVDGLSADVESQGTAITALEGQIKSKVWMQDIGNILGDGIEGTVVKELQELRTQYTELEQDVDSISATVVEHRTLIDNIDIGGRNLIANTDFVDTSTYRAFGQNSTIVKTDYGLKLSGGTTSSGIICPLVNAGCLENGAEYTLSFMYKTNLNSLGAVYVLQETAPNVSVGRPDITPSETEWAPFVWTFSSDTINDRISKSVLFPYVVGSDQWIEIKNKSLKLEKGNKVTDWTPAPEDMESNIVEVSTKVSKMKIDLDGFQTTVSNTYVTKADFNDSVSRTESSINQTNEAIELAVKDIETVDGKFIDYSTTEQMNSEINLAKESITSKVSQEYATKDLLNKSLNNYYTKSETNTEIEQTANTISSSVTEKISEIDIGGRNLLLNSSFVANLDKWSATGTEIITVDDASYAHIRGALSTTYYVSQPVLDKIDRNDPDQTYVFSADVKLDKFVPGTTNPFVRMQFNGRYDNNGVSTWTGGILVSGNPDISTYSNKGWVRIIAIVKLPAAVTEMSCQIYARDFTGDLYFKNFKLEQGNKATDWTPAPEDVEDAILDAADENRTEIIQSVDSIISTALSSYVTTTDYGALSTTVQSIVEQLPDNISFRFESAETAVKDVADKLQTLTNTITKYFTFDDKGLTIGQTESPYKVVIDNDRYSMFVNDVEVMWIANGEVHTPALTVTDKFRLLGLAIDIDSNGNINCEYVGT